MAYRGIEAVIELAKYGLVGTSRLVGVLPSALIDAKNIKFSTGTITRAGGRARYNATPIAGAPRIISLLDWWPASSSQRLLAVTSAGDILRDAGDGTFPVTMGSTMGVGIPHWITAGEEQQGYNRKAFFTNGLHTVQIVDGDAVVTRNIGANAPTDWAGGQQPRFFVLHNNRVFAGMNHGLYWSTVGDHEDFQGTGSGLLSIFPGAASFLQGGTSFRGRIFVFKWPRGIYWMDDSDLDQTNWYIKDLTTATGLAGPNAIAHGDNDVWFLSENAHVMRLSAITEFGDVTQADLTAYNDLSQWTREHVSVTADALARAEARYYAEAKELHFCVCGIGSAVKNLRLILDLNLATPRLRYEDKDVCEAYEIRQDVLGVGRQIAGDDTGTVWLLDQANTEIEGEGYDSRFQTPHDDFTWLDARLATKEKIFQALEFVQRPAGDFVLDVDLWIDGKYTSTVQFSSMWDGDVLGSLVLGTGVLGGTIVNNTRKRIVGSGKRLSLVGRQFEAGSDFSAAEFIVAFKAGGSRA